MGAVAGLVLGTTFGQIATSIEAGREQKKANRERRKIAEGQAALERRKIVREERIKRAQIANQTAQTGTQGSSSAQAAGAGLRTQLGANLATSFGVQDASRTIARREQRVADLNTLSQIQGQVQQTAGLFLG